MYLSIIQGRFEILSLSGSIILTEVGGQRSRTGGVSVSLAGPDGRVLGGGVAGLLTAASPVQVSSITYTTLFFPVGSKNIHTYGLVLQVIMGSFLAEGCRETKSSGIQSEPSSYTPNLIPRPATAGSPPSRGNLSESSGGGPGSPLNQSTGNNNPPLMSTMSWK